MSIILAANNAGTTLAGSLSPTATTVALAVGTGALFPQPTSGNYYVATLIPASSTTGLPNEIVWVTAMSGDTATIVRAREGTTALSFNVGDLFQNLWTAGSFATLAQAGQVQAQAGNWATDTGTANASALSLSPALTSLSGVIGIPIRFKKNVTNTGATTLTVNGLGPIPILSNGGLTAMWAGALPSGNVLEVVYDGTQWELISNFAPPPSSLTNSQLAKMASYTIKANLTNTTANPTDATVAQIFTLLGFTVTSNANGTAINFGDAILQMGQVGPYSQNNGAQTVTFPITFPTGPFPGANGATLAPTTFSTSTDYGATPIGTPSTTSMQVGVNAYATATTSTSFPVNWWCWGN